MRARMVLVALILSAGRVEAGAIDKPKLRELAKLPEISVIASVVMSSTFGFTLNEEHPDPAAEIARLQKQLTGDAGDVERYQRLGKLYHKTGKDKESEEAYSKCVALCREQVSKHPEDMRWLARLGDALTDNGQDEEGEKLLRRAVKEAPDDWWAWLALARNLDVRAVRAVMGDRTFKFHFVNQKFLLNTMMDRKPAAKQIAQMHRLQKEADRCYDRAVQLRAERTAAELRSRRLPVDTRGHRSRPAQGQGGKIRRDDRSRHAAVCRRHEPGGPTQPRRSQNHYLGRDPERFRLRAP